jgi:hypothetical protein
MRILLGGTFNRVSIVRDDRAQRVRTGQASMTKANDAAAVRDRVAVLLAGDATQYLHDRQHPCQPGSNDRQQAEVMAVSLTRDTDALLETGALVWPRLVLVFGIGPSMIAGDSLAVLGTLCIPLVQGPPEQAMLLLTGVVLVVGFAQSMMFIGGGALRQAFSPPELIGRVSASITFVLIGVVPFGALLGGALGEAIGPRGALLVAGVGILLTPVWLFFSPVRSLRALTPD